MITFYKVNKYKPPYRQKTYRAVVDLNGYKRELRVPFRTYTRAEVYARNVIDRYQRVCFAAAQRVDETQAPGNIAERMPV